MFKKILIANRGEIALRILRTCKELGVPTVAVHSVADSDAMHVRLADESVCIGPAPAKASYLNVAAILSAAEVTGTDAIHPGFGFLSENASFAALVREHGIAFIGPSSEHIEIMGDKVRAKVAAQKLGLQTIPGSAKEVSTCEEAKQIGQKIGYPILIKAVAGGGGKGMRVVPHDDSLDEIFSLAKAEAMASFGYDGIYIEKYLAHPRHVEVQILGDQQGQVLCLGERDCSLQRRHQKIWEEAPCAALSEKERGYLLDVSRKAMQKFGYYSVGTLEFLYEDGKFYFIEMNTRIQVEHGITEMVTGIDLVKQQILVAAGYPLAFSQKDIHCQGHAIECRINAENPHTFAPSPGTVNVYLAPGGPFVRVDSALFPGFKVTPYYDSLISKLMVYGQTREECILRMQRALAEYVILGIDTLLPLHMTLCQQEDIQKGLFDNTWLELFLEKQKCL